ncbi:MAG: non-ribosomal peptide synthetase [Caldilineaceae bacterium]
MTTNHPVTLSYGELNSHANQIAHHLQSCGIGPEMLVGIYLERMPLVFAAVLGVLKAGAAYLPLDPGYPAARIAHMLADGQAPLLLTTATLAATLPAHSAQVVLLDEGAPVWQAATGNLDLPITFDQLAYVIYTSGSTGQPKGAMVTHGNFVNAYRGWEASYDLSTCRAHLQMASFSFDVFGGDMVRALCSGAKLVLCPRDWLLEADQLYALMRHEGVECAEFVPAVLRNLVDYLARTGQDLAFMRLVIAGSDVWYGEEYRRLLHFCGPQTRLINSYGITETTIDSTFFELTPAMDVTATLADGALVPIGRPFANVQLYILDQQRQPVPLGVAGDLYIGGAGVSRGYLNRPELTATRFLTIDIEGRPTRLYYTGDRARWVPAPSGPPNVAFLGRADNQVKLRGYRIELGEIETALAAHPAVQQAVVVVHNDGGRAARLVAYVVSPSPVTTNGVYNGHQNGHQNGYHNSHADGAFADAFVDSATTLSADLRTYLQQKLPDYMVPAAIVPLAALPLTPNGKVDRRALPAPDHAALTRVQEPPRTATEVSLAQIWCEVLGLARMGIDDNFFDAGGHSLLALQVINRTRAAFGVTLSLRNLFDAPTIAALAEVIEQLTLAYALQMPVLADAADEADLREEIAI